jgi:hypothetical protein
MSNPLRARMANAVRHGLHYASAKHPLAEIIPDAQWSGMWRVRGPDGQLSDMTNLSRAKDAGWQLPPIRNRRHLHWLARNLPQPLWCVKKLPCTSRGPTGGRLSAGNSQCRKNAQRHVKAGNRDIHFRYC